MSKVAQKGSKTINKAQKEPKNTFVTKVLKRDGSIVEFDISKITSAAYKAMQASEEGSLEEAELIAAQVFADLVRISKRYKNFVPSVEGMQDAVEKELILGDYVQTARAYILYRNERARMRSQKKIVSEDVIKQIKNSSKYFKTPYNEFIFYRTYSRWQQEYGRRETWVEAIDRFMAFMKENLGSKISTKDYEEVREAILRQEVCPSMRLLWSAGKACRKTNVCAYNCAYVAPTKWQDLGDIMYILMCGGGQGYSVESENVEQFPQIQKQKKSKIRKHTVKDSKEGWADAFVLALKTWSSGRDIELDYSQLRPAGAKLYTMGGRSSGPKPLIELVEFSKRKILARQGKRLTTIDMHDIICQIGLIVVSGGVRRSALISLSDFDDEAMRDAKKGQFYLTEGQRSMANNSAVYEEQPTAEDFLAEWTALVKSKSGERGIFNRGKLIEQMPERRKEKMKKAKQPGMNPCGEIYLKSRQFCNLTSIVVRPKDTKEDLKKKVRLATILGTYQASLTNFAYIDKEWKKNCEEEALLGVSITGYYDNKAIRNDKVLSDLRTEAVRTNKKYAKKIGINESMAITCVKPHGNSGQLLGVGSGMHPWFAPYFIRRVRVSINDPLIQFAKDQGIPALPEVGYSSTNSSTMVLEFPVKAPKDAVCKDHVSALDLLHEWKRLKLNFTEHNPSATIYIGEDEWLEVANFIYQNWDIVGGLSFLPRNDHVYQLAPYEEITKEEYERRVVELGDIDYSRLPLFEEDDNTTGAKELACVGGACEV